MGAAVLERRVGVCTYIVVRRVSLCWGVPPVFCKKVTFESRVSQIRRSCGVGAFGLVTNSSPTHVPGADRNNTAFCGRKS